MLEVLRCNLIYTSLVLAAASAATSAGCSDALPSADCGNGVLEIGEFCDDRNTNDGDGCASDCLIERAGPDASDSGDPDAGDDEGDPDGSIIEPGSVMINEFVLDHVGSDTSEYIELFASPNANLSNLAVIVLEGGDAGTYGQIDDILGMGTANAQGFFVTPFLAAGTLENDSLTLLLVDGFTGAQGQDLDSNNDGTLDTQPWTAIIDSVAINDGGTADLPFAGAPVLPINHPVGLGTVAGASRIPSGTDTNAAGDWARNDEEGGSLPCCPAAPVPPSGTALNTPGMANATQP